MGVGGPGEKGAGCVQKWGGIKRGQEAGFPR